MTVLSFFGCTFVAFGPSVAMFALTVAPDAQQVIVFISRCVEISIFCIIITKTNIFVNVTTIFHY